MKVLKTPIESLLIIEPIVFYDDRGYFFESFNSKKYEEAGLNFNFVQDNVSKSNRGTLRGLHYQVGKHAQGKLCQVLLGEVLDVAVDIRFGSPTFGQYFSRLLSEKNRTQLWIPPGFAHGFSVLSDETIFSYKCTSYYNKESERCIIYNDEDINIDWQIDSPTISEKDKNAIMLKNIERDFEY